MPNPNENSFNLNSGQQANPQPNPQAPEALNTGNGTPENITQAPTPAFQTENPLPTANPHEIKLEALDSETSVPTQPPQEPMQAPVENTEAIEKNMNQALENIDKNVPASNNNNSKKYIIAGTIILAIILVAGAGVYYLWPNSTNDTGISENPTLENTEENENLSGTDENMEKLEEIVTTLEQDYPTEDLTTDSPAADPDSLNFATDITDITDTADTVTKVAR